VPPFQLCLQLPTVSLHKQRITQEKSTNVAYKKQSRLGNSLGGSREIGEICGSTWSCDDVAMSW